MTFAVTSEVDDAHPSNADKAELTSAALPLAHEEREAAEKKNDVQDEHEPAVEGGPDNLAIGVIDAIWFRHRVIG